MGPPRPLQSRVKTKGPRSGIVHCREMPGPRDDSEKIKKYEQNHDINSNFTKILTEISYEKYFLFQMCPVRYSLLFSLFPPVWTTLSPVFTNSCFLTFLSIAIMTLQWARSNQVYIKLVAHLLKPARSGGVCRPNDLWLLHPSTPPHILRITLANNSGHSIVE